MNTADSCPKLSICIATYNRSQFICKTLDSILPQLSSGVELLIVDGASTDDTQERIDGYVGNYPDIKYFRESENSGIDRDYDKAVGYASGEYCWLMTDDDLLRPGAISRVLAALEMGSDLVIVNSETKNADLSKTLSPRQLDILEDRKYDKSCLGEMFVECTGYLSFIGAVVIRRDVWVTRDRSSYYGTLFVHLGVIFQEPPLCSAYLIADPLIVIRYGNAMWTSRGFEIWNFKWPELIWSFTSFSPSLRQRVCPSAPWKRAKTLFRFRVTGAYSLSEYKKFISVRGSWRQRFVGWLIACIPGALSVFFAVIYIGFIDKTASEGSKYDVLRSRHASGLSRWFAKALWN